MSKNILLTNDNLQSDIRDGYPDSVDFFVGNKISVEKKEKTEEKPEKKKEEKKEEKKPEEEENEDDTPSDDDEDDVAGLEALILGFAKPRVSVAPSFSFDEVDGQEGIGSTAKSILDAIWKFIKDIGDWIYNLFTNKIARIDTRVKYTNQRRRINGIKTGQIPYPASVKRLFVPAMISASPTWVSNAVKSAETFYKKVIDGHKLLKTFIEEKPKSQEEFVALQKKVLDALGRTITSNGPRNGVYQTDILPGNRIFNIRISPALNSDEILTYFTDSSALVKLKTSSWESTPSLIDEALTTLDSFRDTLTKEQRNASFLIKSFAGEIDKSIRANKKISKETKKYYVWLGNLNKRLTNTTLQYATYCIEALDDFINAGLK